MGRHLSLLLATATAVVCLGFAASALRADTIVLKNGHRIVAAHVVEKDGHVIYETSAGRLSLPLSIVARIERGPLPPSSGGDASMQLSMDLQKAAEADAAVAGAAVHNGAIDHVYIAALENAAGASSSAAAKAAAAHAAAGRFELSRGNFEEALNHYRRALTFAPLRLSLLLDTAYLHLRRSEFSAALDYLDRARRVSPDSADVAKLTGWADYGLNRVDQAVEEWRRAQRLRPDPEVARALKKAERDQKAERDFREGDTSHFVLRYYGAAAPELARDVQRVLEQQFGEISSALDYTPAEPIGVLLYTNREFADITRAPAWVGALNDGRIRVPVQGLTSVTPELAHVLKHELTHSFIQQKTRGRCPVWLQEGIAQWMEGSRSAGAAGYLVQAYEQKASLPLSALEGSWLNLPSSLTRYAYAWSLAVVEYLVASGGLSDVERLLDTLATAPSTDAALRSVLRMGSSDLEQQVVSYLRRTYLPRD